MRVLSLHKRSCCRARTTCRSAYCRKRIDCLAVNCRAIKYLRQCVRKCLRMIDFLLRNAQEILYETEQECLTSGSFLGGVNAGNAQLDRKSVV